MGKYLREYEFYETQYDKNTVGELKALEDFYLDGVSYTDFEDTLSPLYQMYLIMALKRNKAKGASIRKLMDIHKNMDKLISETPVPEVNCDTCGKQLKVCDHIFNKRGLHISFILTCPAGHLPEKTVTPSGESVCLKTNEYDDFMDMAYDPPVSDGDLKKYCTDLSDETTLQNFHPEICTTSYKKMIGM